MSTRRTFLQLVLGSTLAADAALAQTGQEQLYRALVDIPDLLPGLPRAPDQVAGVLELEALAERVLPPAHFGYLYSAAGNGESKLANQMAYDRYGIQPRADAVGFGRPYLWGLAAFGASGVTLATRLIRLELQRAMIQAGAASVADLRRARLRPRTE